MNVYIYISLAFTELEPWGTGHFYLELSVGLWPWQSCCNKILSATKQGKCHFCLQNGHISLGNKWSGSLSMWAGSYLWLLAPWFTVCGSSLAHQYCKLNTKQIGDLLSLCLGRKQLSNWGSALLQFKSWHSTNQSVWSAVFLQLQSAQSVLGFFFSLFLSLSLSFSSQILLQRLVEACKLVLHHSLVKWKPLKIPHNCIVFVYLFSLGPSWCVESVGLLELLGPGTV